MKKFILITMMSAILGCASQKKLDQKRHLSLVSEKIHKNPLPQKVTSDKNQYREWLNDTTVTEAMIFLNNSKDSIITIRLLRISPTEVALLQECYIVGLKKTHFFLFFGNPKLKNWNFHQINRDGESMLFFKDTEVERIFSCY